MPLSSVAAGRFDHKGGGNVGLTTGLIFPSLETFWLYVGSHILLGVRINYYACGHSITRADIPSRELEAYGSGGYWHELMLFEKIVLNLKTLSKVYKE